MPHRLRDAVHWGGAVDARCDLAGLDERGEPLLSDEFNATKDLCVFTIAGALPFAVGPALTPAILAAGNDSYSVLCGGAGLCALRAAAAILPVKRVR